MPEAPEDYQPTIPPELALSGFAIRVSALESRVQDEPLYVAQALPHRIALPSAAAWVTEGSFYGATVAGARDACVEALTISIEDWNTSTAEDREILAAPVVYWEEL